MKLIKVWRQICFFYVKVESKKIFNKQCEGNRKLRSRHRFCSWLKGSVVSVVRALISEWFVVVVSVRIK